MYWLLAYRNIFRNRTRSLVTVSAVAIGCISLITAGGFIQGAIEDVREAYIRAFLGHIQLYKAGFSENGLLKPFDFLIDKPEETIRSALSVGGVVQAAPRIEFPGLLSTGESTMPCLAQGVDPKREVSPLLSIISGSNLSSQEGYEVILGAGLAQAVHAKVGDSLALLTTTRSGALNGLDLKIKGIFRSGTKAFDDRAVRMPLKTAQGLLRVREVQRITLFLDDTERTDEILARLSALFRANGSGLEIRPWYKMDDADFAIKLINYYDRLFLVFKLIIIVVVVLSVFNTMNMSVLERVGEIGTIMALGMKTGGVLRLFLVEGLILGAVGGALGLAGGYALARFLSYVGIPMGVPPTATVEWIAKVRIVPGVFLFAFLQAMITSVFSSFYPALKASRLEIAEALRRNV